MDPVKNSILIVGGGIGGLAAALACAQRGAQAQVIERAEVFSEVGAGIQMGPNVTRTLFSWGLEKALREVVFTPERLHVRDVQSGRSLGVLRLAQRSLKTYGAPYWTVHRADLHQILLQQVVNSGAVKLRLNSQVESMRDDGDHLAVSVRGATSGHLETLQTETLVGADGLWSATRQYVTAKVAPNVTGLLAYRALVPMQSLPAALRTQDVTVWVGPKVHAVLYPVKSGEYLNLVVIVQGPPPEGPDAWDHAANQQGLEVAMGFAHADLKKVLEAVDAWRLWPLCDRPPVSGPHEMTRGRIALLGDAAHPMRPFLAQGAGMAIEDADQLAACWAKANLSVQDRWHLYAKNRWARNAKVQQKSIRNGEIFHAEGVLRWGRDLAMRTLGESIMDVPWLYAGPPTER
jgi:salicylate hydroxylase